MATILGSTANDTLVGTAGADTIEGDDGDDMISGAGGADSINGGRGRNTVDGGDGNDTLIGGNGDERLLGGDGNDALYDAYGNDTVMGGPGDDTVASMFGNDILDGGDGVDTIELNGVFSPVIDLSLTTAQQFSGGDSDVVLNVENVLVMLGAGHVTGSSAANLLEAWDGNDTLIGMAGNDTLKGSYGEDSLDGGAGDDWLMPDTWALPDSLGDRIVTGAGFDVIQLEQSNGKADSAANGHTDILERVLDWDVHDTLYFVSGVPAGAESYAEVTAATYDEALAYAKAVYSTGVRYTAAQVGADVFVFSPRTGDAVVLVGKTLEDVAWGNVTRGGFDALRPTSQGDVRVADPNHPEIRGGEGNDTLTNGGGVTTLLRGDEGNDSLAGGSVFDDLHGNMGNDTVYGGAGDDWVVGGKDEDLLLGEAGGDIVLGNLGNDTLYGGEGNDVVRGGQGDDQLTGQDGNDFVSGDRGNDLIYGGAGADIFHSFGDAGVDWIADFRSAEGDRVNLLAGSTYTVSQVGAHVYVDIDGGARVILADTQLASLPAGWLYVG